MASRGGMVGGIDVRGLRSAAPETSAQDGRPRAAVLVVDKDADVRTALAMSVRRHGDAVATVADHATALRALAQQEFDVVFADVRGAGRGDLAMLHEVRRHRPEATVVLMTAHGTIAEAVHAMQAGASDYLLKPRTWSRFNASSTASSGRRHSLPRIPASARSSRHCGCSNPPTP
jgi:DNA-binding NtrC family response regulator